MTRILLRIAAFVAVTLVLTWLWNEGGRVLYGRFLRSVAPSIYDVLGFDGARVGAMRQRYVNFVPFIGLVLVTPGLSPKRRLLGLLGGILALFVGHLALNLTEVGAGRARQLPMLPSLISDTLPFIAWLVVAAPALPGLWPGFARGGGSISAGERDVASTDGSDDSRGNEGADGANRS